MKMNTNIKKIDGGVTAAKGFMAAGAAAGIKYNNRNDMAMVYSKEPCTVAGTFTSNLVKAAPVKWDQKVVKDSPFAQAIVVNAGIANACTGEQGMEVCRKTATAAGKMLHIPSESVLVASTGVIGYQLQAEKLTGGVEKLVPLLADTLEGGKTAAESIAICSRPAGNC